MSNTKTLRLFWVFSRMLSGSYYDWLETLRFVLNPLEGSIISVFA